MEKIIKLAPSYKDYLWGGTKLREDYGKSSTCEKVAESWGFEPQIPFWGILA